MTSGLEKWSQCWSALNLHWLQVTSNPIEIYRETAFWCKHWPVQFVISVTHFGSCWIKQNWIFIIVFQSIRLSVWNCTVIDLTMCQSCVISLWTCSFTGQIVISIILQRFDLFYLSILYITLNYFEDVDSRSSQKLQKEAVR